MTVDQLYSLVQPSIISPLLFASNLLMFSVTCSKLALTVWDKLHTADNECTRSSLWRHSYCNWQWPGFHQEVDCPQRQQGTNQCLNQSLCSTKRSWQAYTTPTVRGICTFAVFFSVSRPFCSFLYLYNLPCVSVLFFCSFLLQDIFLSLQEFAFEGQNMTFTVNVLLTCITYCDAGPGYD